MTNCYKKSHTTVSCNSNITIAIILKLRPVYSELCAMQSQRRNQKHFNSVGVSADDNTLVKGHLVVGKQHHS